MLVSTILLAIAGIASAVIAIGTLRQIRRDSGDATRPYVVAELHKPPFTRGTQYLIIKNIGRTEARNLTVEFEPPVPDPAPEAAGESVTPYLKRRYEKPIELLTPGQELSNVWFSGRIGPNGKFVNAEPTPDQFTVRVSYTGRIVEKRWYKREQPEFTASFPLDVEIIRTQSSAEADTHPHRLQQELVKQLGVLAQNTGLIRGILDEAMPAREPNSSVPSPIAPRKGVLADPANLRPTADRDANRDSQTESSC